jgi:hypothetical protein
MISSDTWAELTQIAGALTASLFGQHRRAQIRREARGPDKDMA